MFSSHFADYSLAEPFAAPAPAAGAPPTLPSWRKHLQQQATPMRGGGDDDEVAEPFSAEGVIATLGAIDQADTSTRSVALRLETKMMGKTLTGHEDTALNASLED
eukprot:jgi/Tetstr1/461900/TSEL_006978.t1